MALQVACLQDSEAHLALEKDSPFALQTKPHGHGDVHALLHSTGLVKKWKAAGVRWVCFFQDTNGLVFRGLPAAMGETLTRCNSSLFAHRSGTAVRPQAWSGAAARGPTPKPYTLTAKIPLRQPSIRSRLSSRWQRELTTSLPAGVSAREAYDVNSLAVPRKAQEAIGAITCLTHTDGRKMTINVEYNQLDPLLRATTHPEGDANDSSGWSPFPGQPPRPCVMPVGFSV